MRKILAMLGAVLVTSLAAVTITAAPASASTRENCRELADAYLYHLVNYNDEG